MYFVLYEHSTSEEEEGARQRMGERTMGKLTHSKSNFLSCHCALFAVLFVDPVDLRSLNSASLSSEEDVVVNNYQ